MQTGAEKEPKEITMNNIHILVVPNEEIKVRKGFTGADWWWDDAGDLQVRIAAEIGDWRELFALSIHEAFEAGVCKHMGISHQVVDRFDKRYQKSHETDLNSGDESDCPYKIPHSLASAAERIFTGTVGVDWRTYDDKLAKI